MEPIRAYRYDTRRRRWPKVLAIVLVLIIIAVSMGVWVLRRSYYANLGPVGGGSQRVLVTIETGATVHEVALTLQEKHLIKTSWSFEWYVRAHSLRDKIQAGTYEINQTQGVADIVDMIVHGRVAKDLFTILPGQRLDQIKQAFVKAGYTEAEVATAFEPAQYADHPALVDKPAGATLEGYLYPDSFQKVATTKASTIVRQSLDLMQQHLTQEVRAGFVAQGLTVHQGVIVASIVEQEVGKASDRPIVAQVLLRRYHIGMSLGSDVTAYYGAVIAGQKPSVGYDSVYNTRLHKGLPAGPISNVSDSSLKAVAFPASTDYLFFVAGDDGTTHFSHTEAEHEALTRQYCIKLCSGE